MMIYMLILCLVILLFIIQKIDYRIKISELYESRDYVLSALVEKNLEIIELKKENRTLHQTIDELNQVIEGE